MIDPRKVRMGMMVDALPFGFWLYALPVAIAGISFLMTVPLDIFIMYGVTLSTKEAIKFAKNQTVKKLAGYSMVWLGFVGVLSMFLFTSALLYLSYVNLGDIEITLYNCLVSWLIMQGLSTGAASSFKLYLNDVLSIPV